MSPQNLTNVYNQNPTLQGQYTLQQYLDLFGGSSTPPPATIQPVPTPNVPEKGIINQNINQYQSGGGGGGGGTPGVGSENIGQRTIDFNEAITARQQRLNNPGTIQSFVNNFTGGGQSPAFGIAPTETTPGSLNTSMLSRGMLGQKDTRATSGIPFGISGIIASMMPDNYYDKMTLGDQILTQSYMGYTDPKTGMSNKDPFGRNVRSGFGNYAEAQQKSYDKLGKDLSGRLAEKYGVEFDPVTGTYVGTNAAAVKKANDMTKFMRSMFKFDKTGVFKKKDIAADLALIQKAKDEEKRQADIKAKADLKNLTSTASGGGGGGIASSGMTGAQAAGMGGGSRQATSAGSTKSGRTDGGWGWAKGGFVRGSYFNGGIVSLRRR